MENFASLQCFGWNFAAYSYLQGGFLVFPSWYTARKATVCMKSDLGFASSARGIRRLCNLGLQFYTAGQIHLLFPKKPSPKGILSLRTLRRVFPRRFALLNPQPLLYSSFVQKGTGRFGTESEIPVFPQWKWAASMKAICGFQIRRTYFKTFWKETMLGCGGWNALRCSTTGFEGS